MSSKMMDSEEPVYIPSAYEQARLDRIERNKKVLRAKGLVACRAEIRAGMRKAARRRKAKSQSQNKSKEIRTGKRRSSRLSKSRTRLVELDM